MTNETPPQPAVTVEQMEAEREHLRSEILRCQRAIEGGDSDPWWREDLGRFQHRLRLLDEPRLSQQSAATGGLWPTVLSVHADRVRGTETIIRLRDALGNAARQFRFYEKAHKDKGTPDGDEKANTNAEFALMCENALAEKHPLTKAESLAAAPKPAHPNDAARENERLRCALENLVSSADASAWESNTSMMDEAITEARKVLSTTPSNPPAWEGPAYEYGVTWGPPAPSDGVREALERVREKIEGYFSMKSKGAPQDALDIVALSDADLRIVLAALTNPAGDGVREADRAAAIDAMCQARCLTPNIRWDDAMTEGMARIERMLCERQYDALAALSANGGEAE